jgi:FkbM family methyltransferase
VVLDIGANLGLVSKTLAQAVGPKGRVFAVEPDFRCWGNLETLRASFPQVRIVKNAVGATRECRPLFLGKAAEQSSFFDAAVPEKAQDRTYGSDVVMLDDVTTTPVDAVKIDVQGAEYLVLQGASRTLAECPLWVVELWPHGLEKAGATVRDVLARFSTFGFQILTMDGGLATQAGIEDWAGGKLPPTAHINVAFIR